MDDSLRKDPKRPVTAHMYLFTCTYTHICTPIFSRVFIFLLQQQKNLKESYLPQRVLSSPLTNAGSVVLGKARRTFTSEAANGVNTQELTVVLLSCTLIKIYKKVQDGHWSRADSTRT